MILKKVQTEYIQYLFGLFKIHILDIYNEYQVILLPHNLVLHSRQTHDF